MSLQYIIDGYNATSHTAFAQHTPKKINDSRAALLNLIKSQRLTGSLKNTVSVVFDGYAKAQDTINLKNSYGGINILFSRRESADDMIRKLLESAPNKKNIIVVSDDKEIVFFAKSIGARTINVEEFIRPKKERRGAEELLETELTYSQRHKINEELRKLWLKE